MNHIVLSSILPVMAVILSGLLVGRAGWLGAGAVQRLSQLAFMLCMPVLLFRSMSRIHVEQLDPTPALAYTLALALVFAGMLRAHGMSQRGAVLALAATYGNAVMIGIPLVALAWGDPGLVTLFTLVPIHSLLLMTTATVVLEFAAARARVADTPEVAARVWSVGLQALRKALIHPVPMPILAGLLFAQTGLVLPAWLDLPMAWLGKGFGPLALFLVGVSLASAFIGKNLRAALVMTSIKNLLVPLLVAALGWAFGMRGLPLAVMVVTGSLPVGANAFMFSQRYRVAQDVVTASVGVSTAVSALTVSLVLLLFGSQ